jgi:hypothetical protein
MTTATEFREKADRCFDAAHATTDSKLQEEARTRGYQYLKEADAIDRKQVDSLFPSAPSVSGGRMTPLQQVALLQLARVQAHISAIAAGNPPAHSAQANILAVLRKKKAELEQVCGM